MSLVRGPLFFHNTLPCAVSRARVKQDKVKFQFILSSWACGRIENHINTNILFVSNRLQSPCDDMEMLPAISLFASAGIGDLGLKAAKVKTICANELLSDRASLFIRNFPECKVIKGDVYAHKEDIISTSKEILSGREPFLVLSTAPCQGMSSNGLGKLLSEVRKGNRPELDPRNKLILPALDITKELNPLWVSFENVVGMKNTVIENGGKLEKILDIINNVLGPEYTGCAYPVEMADYGVPQCRSRLITIYTKDKNGRKSLERGETLIPPPTHSSVETNGKKRWISVNEAIGKFSPLDGKTEESAKSKSQYLHQVPVLDKDKYFWISNTPINETAFNNQCINPACGYQNNPRHGAARINGINQAKKDTPLYCIKCGSLLPRPCVRDKKNGKLRLMNGYVSAYKRMNPNAPSPTITTNFSFPCSDNKIHPTQNRVLSFAEACVLQTISKYEYKWEIVTDNGMRKAASVSLIREVIGESVPPQFIEQMCRYMRNISNL